MPRGFYISCVNNTSSHLGVYEDDLAAVFIYETENPAGESCQKSISFVPIEQESRDEDLAQNLDIFVVQKTANYTLIKCVLENSFAEITVT